MKSMSHKKQAGFTLVELAIVLVIIGLIIGGVLVGQDLIKAAEIRSTLGQIETYNTTVNAFRDKYRYIPGDINSGQAAQFGFLPARNGGIGRGDGNTLLQAGPTAAQQTYLGHETVLFWNDLNTAGLIDGSFSTGGDAMVTAASANLIPQYLPAAKLGRGNYVTVFSAEGRNFYQITGVTAVTAGVYTMTNALTPQEAFNMDDKIDDGRPLTGGVRAMNSTSAVNVAAAAAANAAALDAGACAHTAATPLANTPYNTTTEARANTPSCQLRFRFN